MRQWRTLAAFFLIELEPHVTVAKSVECTCIAMYICTTVWSPLAPPMFALKYSEHRRGTGEIDDALCNYLHYSYGSRMVARRALPTDPHAVLFVTNYSIVTKCCTSVRFASSYVVDKFELVETGRPSDVTSPPHLYKVYSSYRQNYTVQRKERTLIH